MGLFKAIGNTYAGISSIGEGARKKREGRKLIKLAEARARNAEQQDFVNQSAQIKVDSRATDMALENINLNASQAFQQASDAGIRGIGMIGKIQQNVNQAMAQETARLAEKQFQVDTMAAQEAERQEFEQQRIFERQENRTDAMTERGQALRSQGVAEMGQGAVQAGGGMDDIGTFAAAAAASGGNIGEMFTAGNNALKTASPSGGSSQGDGAVWSEVFKMLQKQALPSVSQSGRFPN